MDDSASTASVGETGLRDYTELARQAFSFGAAASAYAEHRPDYSIRAIEWALEPVTRHRPPAAGPVRILDIGAGTGKLTAQLAALEIAGQPVSVVAIEPDPKMLAELRRQLPGVTAKPGRAEAIPFPDAHVDAVLAGQAAHWFDLDLAMPEIARVLAPGGVLAGLWNADDDRVEWVAGLHLASGRKPVARFTAFDEHAHDYTAAWLAASQRLFSAPERAAFEHAHARTADTLIDTMRTQSAFLVMEPAEREAVLLGVREYLATTPQTASAEFRMPMCTFVIRAVSC